MKSGQLTDIIKVRKRKLLKIDLGLLLFKQSCIYRPVKYFIWYVTVAGWQKIFRFAASRQTGDFRISASRLAADLKVSCQSAGRRPRLNSNTLVDVTILSGKEFHSTTILIVNELYLIHLLLLGLNNVLEWPCVVEWAIWKNSSCTMSSIPLITLNTLIKSPLLLLYKSVHRFSSFKVSS